MRRSRRGRVVLVAAALIAFIIVSAGCGKKGDPVPPAPKPVQAPAPKKEEEPRAEKEPPEVDLKLRKQPLIPP